MSGLLSGLLAALGSFATKLIIASFTETVLAKLAFGILKKLALSTTNTIDDDLIIEVEKAYKGEK